MKYLRCVLLVDPTAATASASGADMIDKIKTSATFEERFKAPEIIQGHPVKVVHLIDPVVLLRMAGNGTIAIRLPLGRVLSKDRAHHG